MHWQGKKTKYIKEHETLENIWIHIVVIKYKKLDKHNNREVS